MGEDQSLKHALEKLARRAKKLVEDNLAKGTINPDQELYHRWKVDKFRYNEQGIADFSSHGEIVTKQDWTRAATKLRDAIIDTEEYLSALEILNKVADDKTQLARALEYFAAALISQYLNNTECEDENVGFLITNLLKDIKEEPLRCQADVELDGIVILTPPIQIETEDMSILLRQTTPADIEKELHLGGFREQPVMRVPTAILQLEFLGRRSNEIQIKVCQAITLLRLFRVGSVRTIRCKMHSNSFAEFLGTFISIPLEGTEMSMEKSVIEDADVKKLEDFLGHITALLPENFYDFRDSRLDHLVIAYRRYCDALLQNGAIERRIANTVMGLESLFLKTIEKQELSYRLKMRIAKLLSPLGYEPLLVKDVVHKAYNVRSDFVHGSHLTDNNRKKLENRFGDIRSSFLPPLLDYLRVSMILMMLMKRKKEKVIELIDDTLVDHHKEVELDNMMQTIRTMIPRA